MHKPRPARRAARIAVALAGMCIAIVAACTSEVGDGVTPNASRASTAKPVEANQPYFEWQVEKAALRLALTRQSSIRVLSGPPM